MDLGLEGKTAVVTGAGRGIGLAITRALVANGAHVVAGSLKSSDELHELAKDGRVQVLEVDLSEPGGSPRGERGDRRPRVSYGLDQRWLALSLQV